MDIPETIGLPRMGKEKGEKRVFLPDFVQWLTTLGAVVYLEEGYGSSGGYDLADYRQGNESVSQASRAAVFQQDVVLVLRAPERPEFDLLRPGSILITMLHYPTRPWRVQRLHDLGIRSISMDSIVDDNNIRLVENMKAVAWNGLEIAFDVLEDRLPDLHRPDGLPVHVLILGTGMVGKHAVDAATKLGRVERNNAHMAAGGSGAVALTVGRNVTAQPALMQTLMAQADILVDATYRRDSSRPTIPNDWIGWLPDHAVIADLSVDPYLLNDTPPVVRGIEGIPQGNLDKYVFHPDDADWISTIPDSIPTTHRRTVVSCYSWPGIHPDACMAHYARQLAPFMEILFEKGYDNLSMRGKYFERALCRATLRHWLSTAHAHPAPAASAEE
jgi:alanine dehydrogenase